jgi:hypothetical protein
LCCYFVRKLEKLEKKDKISKSNKKKLKKNKSKQKVKDSESDESTSDSEDSEKERKSHKVRKHVKKDKEKKRERHYKNVAVKKEPSSLSSDSEVPKRILEKVLGRSIDFAGRNNAAVSAEKRWRCTASSDSSSDRDCKRSAGVKVERNDAKHKPCKEETRKREERSINGVKNSRQRGKDNEERNKRKSTSEGNDSFHKKKQRQ